MKTAESVRQEILALVREYYSLAHAGAPFEPGRTRINYGGRVYDDRELCNLVDSSLEFWLTTGRYSRAFESQLAAFLGVRHCVLTNSGSSANLLAVAALTSPKLGERRLTRGCEIITVAAGFPTTVTPIIQGGFIPVFVDVTLPGYNVDVDALESAVSPRTKAVILAHTLGNPFDIDTVTAFCDKHGLWLIEDNCDALGSKYRGRYTGAFGHIGTQSFYPPHHITLGEGGALFTNDDALERLIVSFRDWGRDCWCAPGKDNTCTDRFSQKFGELPAGYDHKYVFSHFGYNLKVTDMQAAIGCAQMEKLPSFIEARKRNWSVLRQGLADLADRFIFPEASADTDPSWFGFLLTVRDNAGFTRDGIVAHLERRGIQTRMLFAGNLVKHPCFDEMRLAREGYRTVGDLAVTDRIMRDTFWIGVYPGITTDMSSYMIESIRQFVRKT